MADTITFGALNYTILLIYLVIMFGIGLFFSGKQKTTEDYFLAGRKIPWFIVSVSMYASGASAITYMGIPGICYEENIALIVVGFIYLIVAPFMIFLFYSFYQRLRVTTSYEYIAMRYGRSARFTVSALFVLARLGWLGVVTYAPALALSVVTGINIWLAIVLRGVIATSYTILGGLSAVIWTDAMQFTVLLGGAVWLSIHLIFNVPGGISEIFNIAHQTNHLHVIDWKFDFFKMSGLIVAISYFFQIMHDDGTDQVVVQRLIATKSLRDKVKAVFGNVVSTIFMTGLLLFLGLGMFAYFRHFPERLGAEISGDKVLPFYIMHALPQGLSGLLVTAIFAAAMSSMDSGIHSITTVIVNDFVKPIRRKARTELADIRLARMLTLVLGVFAIAIAFYVTTLGHVLAASSAFLGLFGGPILAIFLMGVLTKRANFRGWLVGTVVAVIITFVLQRVELEPGKKLHFLYYFPVCMGITITVGYPASLLFGLFGGPEVAANLTIWGRMAAKFKKNKNLLK